MKSEQINELASALAKAQGEIKGAAKDAANPFFKSKYADLDSVWEACREALSKNGLSVSQMVEPTDNGDVLLTMLLHSSGQWLSSTMSLKIKGDGKSNELHALGSALTYLRRYSLSAIVGVAPSDDDDGNAGKGYQASREQPKPQVKLIEESHCFELEDILTDCNPKYIESLHKHLRSQNIIGLQNIPLDLYERIRDAATKERAKYQESLNAIATAERM